MIFKGMLGKTAPAKGRHWNLHIVGRCRARVGFNCPLVCLFLGGFENENEIWEQIICS